MTQLDGIAGRVAFVSGAGQGIGRTIATLLAEAGALVCVNDIDAGAAADVADRIGGLSTPCDVSDRDAVRLQLARAEGELGAIDLLAINHAFMTMAAFESQTEEDFWRTFDVNLLGTAWLLGECAPAMAARGYGRIVAIASEWGLIGWPHATAYAATKGGLVALVKSIARRYVRAGVAINAIAPGVTDTPQLDVDAADAGLTHEAMVEIYGRDHPLGRIGRTEDIAATAAFLLSESAIAFVGSVLGLNGGSTRI